jgi:hypothetical protein
MFKIEQYDISFFMMNQSEAQYYGHFVQTKQEIIMILACSHLAWYCVPFVLCFVFVAARSIDIFKCNFNLKFCILFELRIY